MALQLAKQGVGQTGSNPSVGCIIVKKDRIIARGRTGTGGRPHAETTAINTAITSCETATMFVTLEPCSHHGKTSPCTESIVNARIARVVCPLRDPDPRVSGTGFEKLREANIKVDMIPNAQILAEDVVRGFISRITKERPFVTVKLGMSNDGKIATKSGDSKWITNKFLRNRGHLLRVQNDAILVGTNTFLQDNPTLNVRGTLSKLSNPLRIFLDRELKVFPSPSVLEEMRRFPSLIVCGDDPNLKNLKTWGNAGIEVKKIHSSADGIDLNKLLTSLGQRGINSLLVEGGGKLVRSLLESNLIDELIIHRSGMIIGSDGVPSIFELKKNSQQITNFPKMNLKSVRQDNGNIESIWKPI